MTLKSIRISTTLKTAGAELPSCFAAATVAASVRSSERDTKSAKASRRRLLDKACRVVGSL